MINSILTGFVTESQAKSLEMCDSTYAVMLFISQMFSSYLWPFLHPSVAVQTMFRSNVYLFPMLEYQAF